MKSILPSPIAILEIAIALSLACPLSAQQPPQSGSGLLLASAGALADEPSFQAEFKHQVELLERSMVGTGVYRQASQGGRRKYRFDMMLRVGEESSSVIQLSNGRFQWMVRDYPGQRNQTRLDLREVRQAIAAAATAAGRGDSETEPDGTGAGGPSTEIKFGGMNLSGLEGLPGTISAIAAAFDLETPRATAIGVDQAWLIEGRIKRAYLDRLAPGQLNGSLEVGRVPSHIPTHVVVILSRAAAWPLFPFRIEYRRANGDLSEPVSKTTPLVSMEFSNVIRRTQFDPSTFEFPAREGKERDITSKFIKRYARKK